MQVPVELVFDLGRGAVDEGIQITKKQQSEEWDRLSMQVNQSNVFIKDVCLETHF